METARVQLEVLGTPYGHLNDSERFPLKVCRDPATSVRFFKCVFDSERRRKKVQVGKDQEKAQSERYSHSKNRGGKKTN